MSVHPIDLAATVCRTIMRELDDKPIRMQLGWYTTGLTFEHTSNRQIADQWTVTLIPLEEFVTIRANGRFLGLGLFEFLDLGAVNSLGRRDCEYVRFPEGFENDPSLIVSEEYVVKLKGVVERALTVVEADYARATQASGR